jgi:hypothetical protein
MNHRKIEKSPPKFVKEASPKKVADNKTNSSISTQQER